MFDLPRHTWILLDSGETPAPVPSWVLKSGLFIVHATARTPETMNLAHRKAGVGIYFIKPWTLEEILAA